MADTRGGPASKKSSTSSQDLWTGVYAALALGQASSAAACVAAPNKAVDFVFGTSPLGGPRHEVVMRLVGCSLASGAACAAALAAANNAGQGDRDSSMRLKLALASFGGASLALAVKHRDSFAARFANISAGTFGATLFVPAVHALAKPEGRKHASRMLKGAADCVRRVTELPRTTLSAVLHSVLSPGAAITGAAYIFAAHKSLPGVLGALRDTSDARYLWRQLGAALLTVLPAASYTLKRKADREEDTSDEVAGWLNAGILATSLGQLVTLGPILSDDDGGKWLPAAVGLWAAALVAAADGLGGLAE